MDDIEVGWPPCYAVLLLLVTTNIRQRRTGQGVRFQQKYNCCHGPMLTSTAITRAESDQQQIVPLTALPELPTTSTHTGSRHDERLRLERFTVGTPGMIEPPPSLRPLEFGDSLFQSPRPNHQKRESSFGGLGRSSIGAPRSIRRTQRADGQRASLVALVPLRLGPVILATTPEPNESLHAISPTIPAQTHQRSESTQGLLVQSKRESYRAQRDTPFQRCQQSSTTALSTKTSASSLQNGGQEDLHDGSTVVKHTKRSSVSRGSSFDSLNKQAREPRASSSERNRLTRKRSLSNARKAPIDIGDSNIDREILELNTIVEERRAEQARPLSPPAQHVAAIAPSMAVRARSDTLNDIGSALARPLTARETAHAVEPLDTSEKRTRPSTSRTSTRVSGWLSGLLPTINTSTDMASREPFYKCEVPARHRTRSAMSSRTSMASVTELNSPSLTAASSPTTKGHGRSLTAESRLTPISPASTVYDYEISEAKKDADDHWPVEISQSLVGLAF